MDILMRNIPFTADEIKVTLRLEPILHGPSFTPYVTSPGLPMNFKVSLFKSKRGIGSRHTGNGMLTLASEAIGAAFLVYVSRSSIMVDGRPILFQKSAKPPRLDILGQIQLLPYRDPRDIRAEEVRLADLSALVKLQDVQFGWLCRDGSFSIEWQWHPWHIDTNETHFNLRFKDATRELVVARNSLSEILTISMRYSRIQTIETDSSNEPSIFLILESAPSYEKETMLWPFARFLANTKRQKLMCLNVEHKRVAPFTWAALRLVCSSRGQLGEFKRLAGVANLKVRENQYLVVRRMLFSLDILRRKNEWLSGEDMPWRVAFQCEALHRDLLLDTAELLELRPKIRTLIVTHGIDHAVEVLRQFGLHLRSIWLHGKDETVESCFDRAKSEVSQNGPPPPADSRTYRCLHVTFTPTSMTLRGPFPDTSNRILRRYPNHHDYFLRVTFNDEDRLRFRFNPREVDGPGFIKDLVGNILTKGFTLCGRPFQFLAYSQSALKQYTMWFVTPFKDRRGYVDAEKIRQSIGTDWAQNVRRCPARFAARLSQAFTATESSVFIELDEIERIDDIERNGYCFSDGNGPLTQDMADAIRDALQRGGGRANRGRRVASVIQVRIQGAKGTLSLDTTLSGMKIGLRPSMVKFESRDSPEVEIARSFDKPGRLFLNRPLIMILSGLGVADEEFLKLQRDAVRDTETSSKTIKGAAHLLETHGLGTAFALPSTLTNLHKLGLDWKEGNESNRFRIPDKFTQRSMKYAVNHVLREMKYRARIPVPKSWKLVGIVDVHNILEADQIYAAVTKGERNTPEYLHGPVVISKSPTIHPGDVQMAFAIGPPPQGSPLGALTNCVVFSQRGDRPLPNKLSGSDLDGDEYDLILLRSLYPSRIAAPGEYPAAPKKILDRDSTINDVADFVVDFINNDMLGIIATNFLLIADRSGIFDPDCLKLAELHNWAVDFPKSGVPVPHDKIPQPPIRIKPDWHKPELSFSQEADYYESQSIIGKLFRDIELPRISADTHGPEARQQISLEDAIERLSLNTETSEDPISTKLRSRLRPLVDISPSEESRKSILKLFDYYTAELKHICFSYTLSRRATSRLSEEEVLMGTIAAKSSQPRIRKDTISSLREETTTFVRGMRKELEGGEEATVTEWVNRAWVAWQVSVVKGESFGAKSFGWIALRSLFDSIKYLEGEDV